MADKETAENNTKVESKTVLVGEIKPWEKNPRKIHPQKYKALKKNIEKYGILEPILVNKRTGMRIISGHQRYRVANELGMETVPVQIIDVDEQTEQMLNIGMNNATGENEKEKLEEVFKGLVGFDLDLELTGFRLDEINNMVSNPDEIEEEDPEFPITPYFGEKYDYVLIFTKNEVDWTFLRNALGLETQKSYKSTAVGTGHVITFEQFEKLWNERRDEESASS